MDMDMDNPAGFDFSRGLSEVQIAELVNNYHLARMSVGDKQYDRMVWASNWFAKEHPDVPAVRAYKVLEAALESPEIGSPLEKWQRTRHRRNPLKDHRHRKAGVLLRDQEYPEVLGIELDRETLTPIRRVVDVLHEGDYGADPLPDGRFRMVPSGDIVDYEERKRRLDELKSYQQLRRLPGNPITPAALESDYAYRAATPLQKQRIREALGSRLLQDKERRPKKRFRLPFGHRREDNPNREVAIPLHPSERGYFFNQSSLTGRSAGRRDRVYVALVTGTDPKYGFARRFLDRPSYDSKAFLIDRLGYGSILETWTDDWFVVVGGDGTTYMLVQKLKKAEVVDLFLSEKPRPRVMANPAVVHAACPRCGKPNAIPDDVSSGECGACGEGLIVQRNPPAGHRLWKVPVNVHWDVTTSSTPRRAYLYAFALTGEEAADIVRDWRNSQEVAVLPGSTPGRPRYRYIGIVHSDVQQGKSLGAKHIIN